MGFRQSRYILKTATEAKAGPDNMSERVGPSELQASDFPSTSRNRAAGS